MIVREYNIQGLQANQNQKSERVVCVCVTKSRDVCFPSEHNKWFLIRMTVLHDTSTFTILLSLA